MYDVHAYGRMMTDAARMKAYTNALRSAVKPGSVVVDVGTGTGIFAMLAARFGARKVYAIDNNPCIRLAREVAARNGLGQIEFIEKSVFDVELPEKADVLVSDCRGAFPLHGRHLDIVIYARNHFLRHDGVVIPSSDALYVSAIEHQAFYDDLNAGWQSEGFDWVPCQSVATSTPIVAAEAELAKARTLAKGMWVRLEYETITTANARGETHAIAVAAGAIHFLALTFRSNVCDIEYGSGHGAAVYGPLFLPLSEPLRISDGEAFDIDIVALATRADYLFSWGIRGKNGARRQTNDGLEFPAVVRQPTTPRTP